MPIDRSLAVIELLFSGQTEHGNADRQHSPAAAAAAAAELSRTSGASADRQGGPGLASNTFAMLTPVPTLVLTVSTYLTTSCAKLLTLLLTVSTLLLLSCTSLVLMLTPDWTNAVALVSA
jgi:hypothetical protein